MGMVWNFFDFFSLIKIWLVFDKHFRFAQSMQSICKNTLFEYDFINLWLINGEIKKVSKNLPNN